MRFKGGYYMRDVPNTKNIYRTTNKTGGFVVRKNKNNKYYSFGYFKDLNDAIEHRDKLKELGFPISLAHIREDRGKLKFIYKNQSGNYTIYHKVLDVTKHFGTFRDLEEAMEFRDYCVSHDWNVKPHRTNNYKDLPKYISKCYDNYHIQKIVDGEIELFGTFDNIEEAIVERDKCIRCNWNWDLIVEME